MLGASTALRRLPLWLIYVVLAAFFIGMTYFVPHDRTFPVINSLKDPPAAILSVLGDMIKLIVTLNTAMMGAAAAVTIKGQDWTSRWGRLDSGLIILTFVCGAISYFGVYLAYVRILTMAAAPAPTVNPLEGGIVWSFRLQYYGTIAGVVLLGLVFARILEGRLSGQTAKPNHAC